MKASLAKLVLIATHCGARLCVTSGRLKGLLGELHLRVPTMRPLVTVEELEARGDKTEERFRASGDDPAFIQYTSGSTGNPKGVLLSHRNVVSNIHAIGQALRINRTDVEVSWCPLYHDMGLIGAVLFAIYWRIPLVLMSPTAFLALS